MTTAQAIAQCIEELPEVARRQVLDFVEHLRARNASEEGARTWSAFSLSAAMRGMEDEPSPYTVRDLKESFR